MPNYSFLSLPVFLEKTQTLFLDRGALVKNDQKNEKMLIFIFCCNKRSKLIFWARPHPQYKFLPSLKCSYRVLFVLWH